MNSGEALLHDLKNRAVSLVERRQSGRPDLGEESAVATAAVGLYEHLCLAAGDCVRCGLWSPRMLAEIEKRLAQLRSAAVGIGKPADGEGMSLVRDQLVADYHPGTPARGVAKFTFFGGAPVSTAVRVVADCLLSRELARPARSWWHREGEFFVVSVAEAGGGLTPLPIRLPARALGSFDGGVLVAEEGVVSRCRTWF